jgi:hypothetical protein
LAKQQRHGGCASVLSAQRLDQVHIRLHGRIAARAFETGPSVPFGAAHHVAEPGFFLGVVAHRGLFVERVELEQGGVAGAFGEGFGLGDGGFKAGGQVGHGAFLVGVVRGLSA